MVKGFGIIIVRCADKHHLMDVNLFDLCVKKDMKRASRTKLRLKRLSVRTYTQEICMLPRKLLFIPSEANLEEANQEATPVRYKALQHFHQLLNVFTKKLKQKCHEEGSGLLSDTKVQKNRSTSQNTVGH